MRSNTLRKPQYLENHDNSLEKPGEVTRLYIAAQTEEACHLPGNINGPDLGEFEEKYLRGHSTFA